MSDPERPATATASADGVLVVDVQRSGTTRPGRVPGAEALLTTLHLLVERARAAGVPVVHLQHDGGTGAPDEAGTDGWELALRPAAGEPVVRKTTEDGFHGTDLDSVLRHHAVSSLLVCGVQSEMCVAATARGALAHGLEVVLPRDTHASYPIPGDGPHAPAVPADLVARVAEWSLGDQVALPDRAAEVALVAPDAGAQRSPATTSGADTSTDQTSTA